MNAIDPYIGTIKAVIVIAFMLGLVWVGHHYGAQGVQAKWDADNLKRANAEQAAIAQRFTENKALSDTQAETNRLIKKGYENEITKIHADSAAAGIAGLRLPPSVCNSTAASTNTEGASGSNASPASTRVFPEPYNGDLRALMQEADMIVASCRAAQDFIKSNGLAP